jgi:hypothetical protein
MKWEIVLRPYEIKETKKTSEDEVKVRNLKKL